MTPGISPFDRDLGYDFRLSDPVLVGFLLFSREIDPIPHVTRPLVSSAFVDSRFERRLPPLSLANPSSLGGHRLCNEQEHKQLDVSSGTFRDDS